VRGLFVTGTDTGVGKTVLAAVIAAGLRARGQPVTALKPVITGLQEPADPDWPPDHELLAQATGREPRELSLLRYGPPVSPHLAAELAGAPVDGVKLVSWIREQGRDDQLLVVEGVGGLLVPLGEGLDVRSLCTQLGLPIVIAARPGLGTINHTLLTLEAARSAALSIAAVVLTPWPSEPSVIERSNHATIEQLGDVRVDTLARLERLSAEQLLGAAQALPLEKWFATLS